MKTDGVFTIQSGQGISQGIVQELGLSADQAKKIDKTTWNSIFKEIEKQKQTDEKLYAGGSNLDGKTSQNFVVQPGQTVKISLKDTWGNILNILNNHLGTNFEVEENKINQTNLGQDSTEPIQTSDKRQTTPANSSQGEEVTFFGDVNNNEILDPEDISKDKSTPFDVSEEFLRENNLIGKPFDYVIDKLGTLYKGKTVSIPMYVSKGEEEPSSYTQFTFDDEGKIISGRNITPYDYATESDDPTIAELYKIQYRDQETIDSRIDPNNNKYVQVESYNNYQYDDNGRLISYDATTKAFSYNNEYKYEYDENGNLKTKTQIIHHPVSETMKQEKTTEYNEEGQIINITGINMNQNPQPKITYHYDEQGRVVTVDKEKYPSRTISYE